MSKDENDYQEDMTMRDYVEFLKYERARIDAETDNGMGTPRVVVKLPVKPKPSPLQAALDKIFGTKNS